MELGTRLATEHDLPANDHAEFRQTATHDVVIEYARDGYVFHYAVSSTPLAFTADAALSMSMRFGEHT